MSGCVKSGTKSDPQGRGRRGAATTNLARTWLNLDQPYRANVPKSRPRRCWPVTFLTASQPCPTRTNDDEDDEGDEDYTVSEDEGEVGDRAPKRQRRISECSKGDTKEGRSRSPAKSTSSAQSTEGCTASQKDRHSSAELLTGAGPPSIPMKDILMLASNIASAVVEQLTGYSVESGEVIAYSKRDRPPVGRSTKGYEERLRDGGSRLRRWSKEDDEQLLALIKAGHPWSKIEKDFPQRTAASLRQRVSVLRKSKKRKRT
ncbi:hypothetical protein AJ78_05983 [Emergomyces pasteurianus Ep9510]|uniref:Uncharacterized protein n=1 Tax=Emergomyces pasteurianus Ep9510 TaxID=1447872 RepID=A0A1J9QBN8_9EURO|nr:hypothetical protein AJ78_05983 [Emergomyces pasteurianus Ep9510]